MREENTHYDDRYFEWQSSIGEFGGWANLTKFEQYIRPEFNVLDFGCGGGYLLNRLSCHGKIGIEINDAARQQTQQFDLTVYSSIEQVDDEWADIIISNHALEHVHHPLQTLRSLYSKLKPYGRIVFVVPCEGINRKYSPDDVNQHLYTWNPSSLGNLFAIAGFVVDECDAYIHKWPPKYRYVARFGGRRLFEFLSHVTGHIRRSWFQVRVVAHRLS